MPTYPEIMRVLIADGDATSADSLSLILRKSGCEAVSIDHGIKAEELESSFMPHALICDASPGNHQY